MSDSGIGLSAHLSSPLIFSYIRTYVLSFLYTIIGFLHLTVNTYRVIFQRDIEYLHTISMHAPTHIIRVIYIMTICLETLSRGIGCSF